MSRELLSPESWRDVKRLFEEALALPLETRAAHVTAATTDARVRDEVLSLLQIHETAGGFLEPKEHDLLEPGHRLGPYQVRAHLGGGGMGQVYRARDTRLGRDVAVKVLHGRLADDVARARFEREARAIAALSHPNVLALFDVGDAGGLPYLVTEVLEGENLRERLRRGPPPVAQAVEWAIHIAAGLAAAHEHGIVHRDLKPENVFLLADGRVKILDFGLARPLAGPKGSDARQSIPPGVILGTAGYLAPELARGEAATTSADLFALGAMLFELLTGTRAFRGEEPLDTLRAVMNHQPPPPSSLRPDVPRWLDRVVARCLAKEPAARFQSARDLAFVLGAAAGDDGARPAAPAPRRRWWRVAAMGATALALAGAALVVGRTMSRPRSAAIAPPREPPRPYPLTHAGRDNAPAVSPDGRFLAFASDRTDQRRIWLQQLDIGREVALTDGPDDAPRFSPDGAQLLFTRAQGDRTALYRVSMLGGEPRLIVDDAAEGDWSPDGRQVAFVRWRDDEANQARPVLMVAGLDGVGERELARLDFRVQVRPRWSPDGRMIAVTGLVQQPGAPQRIVLVPADGSPARTLPTPNSVGLVSTVAWEGPGALIYSQALSVTGNSAGSAARIVRQRIDDGAAETLLWSPESSLVLDRWPGRGIVFDTRSSRQNLRGVSLITNNDRVLSNGTASDRQPVFAPDGDGVVFSSNRGTNLDIWLIARESRAQRLTDHPADDWDPAFTPDGEHLVWSSNRTGNFEIWMADRNGANPRQVTHDGVDAENPTVTADGQQIVFSSSAPGRAGVWKIRIDGSEPARLVPDVILPEVSPDGTLVLFQTNRSPRQAVVGVAEVAGGRILPFEIRIEVIKPTPALLGRARWMPGGRSIAFLGQDEQGATGVYVQDFAVGEDTSASRRPLAGFVPERITESFGVSPDGRRVVLAEWEQRSAIVAVTGL